MSTSSDDHKSNESNSQNDSVDPSNSNSNSIPSIVSDSNQSDSPNNNLSNSSDSPMSTVSQQFSGPVLEPKVEPHSFPNHQMNEMERLMTPKQRRRRMRLRQYKRFLDPVEFTFPCVVAGCSGTFKLTSELCEHIRAHFKSEDPKCPQCGLSCAGKGGMSSFVHHIRTHTGQKPYRCPIPLCNFASATKGNLKAHLLAARHKDIMSVELLNVILGMDTTNRRRETELSHPRGSIRRYRAPTLIEESMSMMALYRSPPRKRRRTEYSRSRTLEFAPLPPSSNRVQRRPRSQTTIVLNQDTSRFYSMASPPPPHNHGSFVLNGIHAQHKHRQATLSQLRSGFSNAVPVMFIKSPMGIHDQSAN